MPQPLPVDSPKCTRRPDLDRLRLAACLLLFPFHTLEVFDTRPAYHIKSLIQIPSFDALALFINAWHMPLFFLLSGMASMLALTAQSRSRTVVWRRLGRLVPPMVFGLLTIAPAIKYLELTGGRDMSHSGVELVPGWCAPPLIEFYFSFWAGLEVFSWSHLWFLVYLSLLTLCLTPLLVALVRSAIRLPRGSQRWLIWIPGILAVACETSLRPLFGDLHNLSGDWANIVLYAGLMLVGALLIRFPELEAEVVRQRSTFWSVTLVGMALMAAGFAGWNDVGRGLVDWGMIGTLLGVSFTKTLPVMRGESYLARAQLWIYIVHHLPLLMLALLCCNQSWPLWGRLAVICLGSFVATMMVYHWALRPVLVFVAQMKSDAVSTKVPPTVVPSREEAAPPLALMR